MLERANDYVIIASIALTVPFICYCIEIVVLWWPNARKAWRETCEGKTIAPSAKLAKGIWTGFAANFFDNLYWGVTWLLVLFHHPFGLYMMMSGSLANVFFRQIGGILAARDHVDAANRMHNGKFDSLHKYYWMAGGLTLLALVVFYG